MGLMMAVVWVPLLVVLVWVLRQFGGSNAPGSGSSGDGERAPDARELARRAYARGEMDRERYLEVIADLDRTEGR